MKKAQRGSVSTGIVMPLCVGAALFALTTWLGFHTLPGSRWHSWSRWPWWAEALSILAVLASLIAMSIIDQAKGEGSVERDRERKPTGKHDERG